MKKQKQTRKEIVHIGNNNRCETCYQQGKSEAIKQVLEITKKSARDISQEAENDREASNKDIVINHKIIKKGEDVLNENNAYFNGFQDGIVRLLEELKQKLGELK